MPQPVGQAQRPQVVAATIRPDVRTGRPISAFRSHTSTARPASASGAAIASPAGPPPAITTSYASIGPE